MFHVITKTSAIHLGIVSSRGVELRHSATQAQVASEALSVHSTLAEATSAAAQVTCDTYVIDSDGDSYFVAKR